jgi:hypothetical protein
MWQNFSYFEATSAKVPNFILSSGEENKTSRWQSLIETPGMMDNAWIISA